MQKKTILITGASSGFGHLAALGLLQRGHTVIAGIRGGQERARTIQGFEPFLRDGRLIVADLHLDDSETFKNAISLIEKDFSGGLDVLINNAGYGLMGPIETQSSDQIRKQFEVNFFGPLFFTQALIPHLRHARGRIINVSSIAGLVTFPFYGSYAASKHALDSMTEALYYDLKPFGVQVALVEPGGFKTSFTKAIETGNKDPGPYFGQVDQFLKSQSKKASQMNSDPNDVIQLMIRLCEQERIGLRHVIGKDAWMMYLSRRFMPDRMRLFITDFVFRKVFLAK